MDKRLEEMRARADLGYRHISSGDIYYLLDIIRQQREALEKALEVEKENGAMKLALTQILNASSYKFQHPFYSFELYAGDVARKALTTKTPGEEKQS